MSVGFRTSEQADAIISFLRYFMSVDFRTAEQAYSIAAKAVCYVRNVAAEDFLRQGHGGVAPNAAQVKQAEGEFLQVELFLDEMRRELALMNHAGATDGEG